MEPRDPSAAQDLPQKISLTELHAMKDIFMEFTGAAADIPFASTTIPARDGYQIPIRIYNPKLDASTPVLIIYPGCGYVLDLMDVNAIAASRIAKYADIKVVVVNLRLCPEVAMPVPIYDAYDAAKYIAQHSSEFNIDPNKTVLAGFSAGAHAASSVTSTSRYDNELMIFHQILLNGNYDLTQSMHDFDEFEAQDKLCQRGDGIDFIFEQYDLRPEQFSQALFSPLFEKDVSDIADTSILVGEYDGLRNDSEAYCQHLNSQNNNIERVLLPGQTHNTFIM